MLTLPLPCPNGKCLTVIALDAGQGDCTLVVFPDGSLLVIDCGSSKNSKIVRDEIEQVLTAYAAHGQLKGLILTHPNIDHYNLIARMINRVGLSPPMVLFGGSYGHYRSISRYLRRFANQPYALGNAHYSTAVVPALSFAGSLATGPAVDVRILAANAFDKTEKEAANDNSVVVMITFLDVNIFVMGDATFFTEEFILGQDETAQDLSPLLQAKHTMVRVGHHGSTTSSTQEWVDKIDPEVVIISSDMKEFNGTGLPREEVVQRYADKDLHTLPDSQRHFYVEFVDDQIGHEQSSTKMALCTTLHLLNPPQGTDCTAYGTSWYYTVTATLQQNVWTRGNVYLTPACSWDNVNTAY